MLDSDKITKCGPEKACVHPRVEGLAPRIANELKVRDDKAEIRTQRKDCARADLREIIAAGVGRLTGIDFPIEEGHGIVADDEFRRRILSTDNLPRPLHPHRVI